METIENKAEILSKLFRTESPIKVQRYKYEIQALKKKLDVASGVQPLPRPGLLGKLRRNKQAEVILDRVAGLKAEIEKLSAVVIDAFLVPLTQREHLACVNEYTSLRLYLLKQANHKTLTAEARESVEQATDLTCEAYFLAKRVQYALKRKTGDGWMMVFNDNDLTDVDPRLITDIWIEYIKAFQLSEEDRKKSLAPIPAN